jgi:hypothetical protein
MLKRSQLCSVKNLGKEEMEGVNGETCMIWKMKNE